MSDITAQRRGGNTGAFDVVKGAPTLVHSSVGRRPDHVLDFDRSCLGDGDGGDEPPDLNPAGWRQVLVAVGIVGLFVLVVFAILYAASLPL